MVLVIARSSMGLEIVAPRAVRDDELIEAANQRFVQLNKDYVPIARLVAEYIPEGGHCRLQDMPLADRPEFLTRLAIVSREPEQAEYLTTVDPLAA